MTIYILVAILTLGMLLFGIGLINMVCRGNEKKDIVIAIIGAILFITSGAFLTYEQQQRSESLLQNIAEKLDADTSEIIVEDISEKKLFSPSKNENLRKVYLDSKIYLVEVKGYKIIKIVEQQ